MRVIEEYMIATIIISLLLLVLVAGIIRYLIRQHKKGHCAFCPYAGSCNHHCQNSDERP